MIDVAPPNHSTRLDLHITETFKVSRRIAQNWIKSGRVRVNGAPSKPSYIVIKGDQVACDPEENSDTIAPENIPLSIVFEDDDLLVLNKPPGMVVHPAVGHKSGTLVNALIYHFNSLSDIGGIDRPGIVHRLDKDSEGLMVVTKTNIAHFELKKQFKDRTVEKKYYAMVKGNVREDDFQIDLPVGRGSSKAWKMMIKKPGDENAKEALTRVKVIKRYVTKTLLEVSPKTGRTHQIRVHLAHIGHPLLGDPLYLKRHKGKGQLLQAFFLAFTHPVTKKWMSFSLPISKRLMQ